MRASILGAVLLLVPVNGIFGGNPPASQSNSALAAGPQHADPISFDGVHAFSTASILGALQCSLDVQSTVPPLAPLPVYLEALRSALQTGYAHAGFGDAKIELTTQGPTTSITAHVAEGRSYQAGKVRVLGNKAVSAEALATFLTTLDLKTEQYLVQLGRSMPAQPAWDQNDPAPFDAPTQANLRERIQDGLSAQGFYFAKFHFELARDVEHGMADLVIHLEEEGPAGVLKQIEVTGNRRHSRDEILQYVGLAPGMRFDREVQRRTYDRLWRSGRFWQQTVEPKPSQTPGQTDLCITVTERDACPRLNESLAAKDLALLKLHGWLMSFPRGSDELEFEFTGPTPLGAVKLGAIFSPQEGWLIRTEAAPPGKTPRAQTVVWSKQQCGYYAVTRGRALRLPAVLGTSCFSVVLRPFLDEKEKKWRSTLMFGLGINSDGGKGAGVQPIFEVWPVTLLANGEEFLKQATIENGLLTTKTDDVVLEVEAATGRLRQLAVTSKPNQTTFRVRAVRGAFAAAVAQLAAGGIQNDYHDNAPLASVTSFVLDELLWLADSERPTNASSHLAAIEKAAARYFARRAPGEPGGREFAIPVETTKDSSKQFFTMVGTGLLWLSDSAFPRDSWPWNLLRAGAFATTGRWAQLPGVVSSLYRAEGVGPIGHLAAAQGLALLNPGFAKLFAQAGLERLSAADFRKDARLLSEADSGGAHLALFLTEVLAALTPDEQQRLVTLLPAGNRTGAQRVLQLLGAHAADSGAGALDAILDEAWQVALRQPVEGALHRLAGDSPR